MIARTLKKVMAKFVLGVTSAEDLTRKRQRKMDEDVEKLEEARKELEDSILEEILKPITDWLKTVLKGETK